MHFKATRKESGVEKRKYYEIFGMLSKLFDKYLLNSDNQHKIREVDLNQLIILRVSMLLFLPITLFQFFYWSS